jgi:2-keto-myo-inositol isomerase
MITKVSRRQVLTTGTCLGATVLSGLAAAAEPAEGKRASRVVPLRYCLNTGTLQGHKLPLPQVVAIAAKVGYQGIEPWIREIQQYVKEGGSLADLKKRIADSGLTVESAIGFPTWCVDDDVQRAKGMEQIQQDMDLVAQLGGARIAAPPAGANKQSGMDLRKIGERYRAVLELGQKMGVRPQLEIWGASKTLSRISEAAFVAIEAAHPDACVLLDVFHVYKSGANFAGVRLLNGAALQMVHINDYPADPPRETATDADRVFPGDGVAPLSSILGDLRAIGFGGVLSLELFNREYWKQDPQWVAKIGLEKMRAVVQKAAAQ